MVDHDSLNMACDIWYSLQLVTCHTPATGGLRIPVLQHKSLRLLHHVLSQTNIPKTHTKTSRSTDHLLLLITSQRSEYPGSTPCKHKLDISFGPFGPAFIAIMSNKGDPSSPRAKEKAKTSSFNVTWTEEETPKSIHKGKARARDGDVDVEDVTSPPQCQPRHFDIINDPYPPSFVPSPDHEWSDIADRGTKSLEDTVSKMKRTLSLQADELLTLNKTVVDLSDSLSSQKAYCVAIEDDLRVDTASLRRGLRESPEWHVLATSPIYLYEYDYQSGPKSSISVPNAKS